MHTKQNTCVQTNKGERRIKTSRKVATNNLEKQRQIIGNFSGECIKL